MEGVLYYIGQHLVEVDANPLILHVTSDALYKVKPRRSSLVGRSISLLSLWDFCLFTVCDQHHLVKGVAILSQLNIAMAQQVNRMQRLLPVRKKNKDPSSSPT
jgi:hypothetical protein